MKSTSSSTPPSPSTPSQSSLETASPVSSGVSQSSSNVPSATEPSSSSGRSSSGVSVGLDFKDRSSSLHSILATRGVFESDSVPQVVSELLHHISTRVPIIAESAQLELPNPYAQLVKGASEPEFPPSDYTQIKRFIEIVESRIASGTWTPYFDVLKSKFERVLSALKDSRNQKLGEMLLQRQAEVNRVVKDVTEKPEIGETLAEKQKALDGCLQRLQACLSSLRQLEAVGFDSRAEKQLKELLPLCDEIENLVDDKMGQLETLREIYADFVSLDDEKAQYVTVMSQMAADRARERDQCTSDLNALQANFARVKDEEAHRSVALEAEGAAALAREKELDQEDAVIAGVLSRLVERYETNQTERRKLTATRATVDRELATRARLLVESTESVQEQESRLRRASSDLSAASEAIQAFLDGTLKEIDQLDKMTAGRHADYKRAVVQALKEKYETSVQHYRITFKKAHALRNFKATSQKLLSELHLNLRRWSELKRAAMVDAFNEQIGKSQQELKIADEELETFSMVLLRLDGSFGSINAKMAELGEQPLLHPGLDIEAECLEQDRRRLEEERAVISDNRSTVEDELRLVNSRLESANLRRANSQLLASSVSPSDPSASFVQVESRQE